MRKPALIAALVVSFGWALLASADAGVPLAVHEWGTITTVHAATGTPQGKLNKIQPDEVLPDFVHRYEPSSTRQEPKLRLGKSPLVPGRPDVTMRLETPVIYFYPGGPMNSPVNVTVRFRGGVLNEYYPDAEPAIAVDMQRIREKMDARVIRTWDGRMLNNYVVSSLSWKGLKLVTDIRPPVTSSLVWRAPREVRATGVSTAAGESERYVFYRGVAHLDALLQTQLTPAELRLNAPARLVWLKGKSANIPRTWYASIRSDGTVAYREHGTLTLRAENPGAPLGRLNRFEPSDYDAANLGRLRASMKLELVAQGLFEDEAQAMLNTWQASYFEKPGARVFYIVPKEWTNYFLPLEISVPAEVTRVIVGRVDLLE
jgi:hypothetical protein